MNQAQSKMGFWVRLDGNGFAIPGSCVARPLGVRPRGGNWRQLQWNYCCGPSDTLILFRNTTGSADITAISTSDGTISSATTINNGEYLMFVIPNGYDQTWSITVDTPTGRTLTTAVSQQNPETNAAISAIGAITLATNTFTTSGVGGQFTVILS